MLNRILPFDVMRVLKWDVGAAIKRILLFDLNRILYADVDQLLSHPLPQIVFKAIVGWFAAIMLTLLILIVTVDEITPTIEMVQAVVSLALVVTFIGPDVRRLFRGQSTA